MNHASQTTSRSKFEERVDMNELTLLASGYQAVEGPVIDRAGDLYFSDTLGGGVYCLRTDGSIETIVAKRKGAGGIVLHADGGIVISGRDLSHIQNGETRIIIAREDVPPIAGTRVGGFNDITADRVGRIFAGCTRFTDDGVQVPGELLMVTGTSELTVVYGGVALTNGIAQSADGTRLFHADTEKRRIIVSEMTDDGVPVQISEFTSVIAGRPDGIAADGEGGVWAAWGSYVLRFDESGAVDGQISVPAEHTLNCCFAGDELREMYIVTLDNTEEPELGGCIYHTTVGISGTAVSVARV
jgi:sugar lactone lactonase YvrE